MQELVLASDSGSLGSNSGRRQMTAAATFTQQAIVLWPYKGFITPSSVLGVSHGHAQLPQRVPRNTDST